MRESIAIVTSCHNYGKYLNEWAQSIIALTRRPDIVCIVDAGSTDDTPALVARAAQTIEQAGIPVRTTRIEETDLGVARNTAVELAGDVVWVQHFDCDDTAMPHMLNDWEELAPVADVVPMGYLRSGDLKAGPRNRRRVYSNSQGKSTLTSSAPASGVSPFRKSFWEKSPYRTDMIGGWDTALWIGFAHLNARFIATKRPCFYYRQHADSIFNQRRNHARNGHFVGVKLGSLRNNHEGVSVLVPFQPDGGYRDQVWEYVKARWQTLHPDFEIVEGHCPGEWRKGEAVRDAFQKSTGRWLILADADCIVSQEGVNEAVEAVMDGAPWAIPHRLVKRLDEASTQAILAGGEIGGGLHRRAYEGFAGGGMLMVERAAYEATGGIPTRFRQWGAEDEALAVILDTLIGPHVRFEHDMWHLWHPAVRRHKHNRANRQLYVLISSMTKDPDKMWDFLHGLNNGTLDQKALKPVVMVADRDFTMKDRQIKKGDTLTATEAQARRLEHQRRKLAHRVATIEDRRALSKMRTLDIRAEQRERNEAARKEKTMSLSDRRLARAGVKTRARMKGE